jgi:FlaA1/EpsC-like NDP-sugar epimerase
MFSRLDLVFLAVIAGIWLIFRGKPIRYLLPLDMLIIFASMTVSVALRTGLQPYNDFYASSAVEAAALALIANTIALYFFGAYQHPRIHSVWGMFRRVFFAVTIGTAITVALYLILVQLGFGGNFPRTAFLLNWGLS